MPKKAPQFKQNRKPKTFATKRLSAAKRGYGSAWHHARLHWLSHHPLCAQCQRDGFIRSASEVDHVIPHKGDKKLFWDSKNWQSLCKPCHSRKTAKEDGGFGNEQY